MKENQNIVLQLKDHLKNNYKIGRHHSGTTTIDGYMIDFIIFNSVYIDCKIVIPKTPKGLLRSILNSNFVDECIADNI